jgi:replicative DNA helicase
MVNEEFDEKTFIWSLTARPEDARYFFHVFRPQWMKDPANQAVLAEMYSFMREYKVAPDLSALERMLRDKDDQIFEARLAPVFKDLKDYSPSIPEQVYVLEQAKKVAMIRSFTELLNDQDFKTNIAGNDGFEMVKSITKWLHQFEETGEEETRTLKDAVEAVIKDCGMEHFQTFQMETGIEPVDEWTGGGLRSKNVGIFLAPTGHGKSVILMNIAFKMSIQDEMNVWFITNELTMQEQTERFMSRITTEPLSFIQSDPYVAYNGMGEYWTSDVNNRLLLTSVNKDISVNEIEAMMTRYSNLHGWKPKVICLDYIERMKPNEVGYDRNKEWNWYGAIAKDLVRFAKKHNIIVWTAAQTNRSGMTDKELSADMAQGSIKHLQEASAVIALRRTDIIGSEDDPIEEGMEFKPLKMRHGKVGKGAILRVNLHRMEITNEEGKKVDRTAGVEDTEKDQTKSKRPLSFKKSK